MLGAEAGDDLDWLAGRYEIALSKDAEDGRWRLTLYWPQDNWETGGTSFHGRPGGDLAELVASARAWAEEPLAADLDGRDWLRLCTVAAKRAVPAQALIRQGARELLDRLEREEPTGPARD